VTDLFGVAGRELLDRVAIPQPWRGTVDASLALIEDLVEDLERQIDRLNRELRASGADHRFVPLLLTVPGIGWVLAFTIAAEIGLIDRFATAQEAGRLHRPVPEGQPVRRPRPTRAAVQARPPVPAQALLEATMHALRRTPPSQTATSATSSAWAAGAAPRSPRSTSPEGSPKRSGTCSRPTSPSTLQPPLRVRFDLPT
jgi:transposase